VIKTSHGWIGFWAMEASEVLFVDRYPLVLDAQGQGQVALHPVFSEACESDSIGILSMPGFLRATVANGTLRAEGEPGALGTVWAVGVRKNSVGRFQPIPESAARRNNAFWAEAWR